MGAVIPIAIGALVTVPKCLEKGERIFGNWKTTQDHQDDRIVKIGAQNTKKNQRNLK